MRICVFCSSSKNLPQVYVDAAYNLGREMALRGHELVFGGFDLGTMGDVARGCAEAGGRVWGVVTEGLMAQGRPVFPCTEVICEPDLARRKMKMNDLSDAFITLPGGLGTFDEYFDIMAQLKAGERKGHVMLLNVEGYFEPLVAMLDKATATGLNATDWRSYGDVFPTAAEVLDYLEKCAQ